MMKNPYLEMHGSKIDEINFDVFYILRSIVWYGCMSCLNNFSVQIYLIHVFAEFGKYIVIKI